MSSMSYAWARTLSTMQEDIQVSLTSQCGGECAGQAQSNIERKKKKKKFMTEGVGRDRGV